VLPGLPKEAGRAFFRIQTRNLSALFIATRKTTSKELNMQKTTTILTTLAALAALTGSAIAQTPPPPPPVHHGLFGKLFHPHAKPGQPAAGNFGRPGTYPGHPGTTMGHMNGYAGHHGMGSMTSMGGGFIGNKNSHVYHMPGDKGAMPSAQNRVYFPTAAAAEAAGYRRVGSKSGMMGHHPMMQGSPRHGMMGHPGMGSFTH
jgi:hypothetical protein